MYDADGTPVGMQHRTTSDAAGDWDTYYYEKNLQGDVIAIYNVSGIKLVTYNYDAWGNFTRTDVASSVPDVVKNNPITYRGYYYDHDLDLYYLTTRYYDPETCRFVTADDPSYLGANGDLVSYNLYAYCSNNPVMYIDPTGQWLDVVLDIGFICWGIYDLFANEGYSEWENWVALGIDVAFAVIPFVPSGASQVIKVGNKIDNAADVASAINKIDNIQDVSKATMIGRKMNRVTDTATLIGKADNLYRAWKGYDATATGLKRTVHCGISMLHNAGWMFGKLRSGYTVIDIGMTTLLKGRGLYYGAERFVISLWKTRNLWKIPINYYS